MDFGSNKAKKAISAYVEDKTHGLINGNIDLPPETLITLINTFYLKEVWNDEGDKLKFTDKTYDFTNADQSITETKRCAAITSTVTYTPATDTPRSIQEQTTAMS